MKRWLWAIACGFMLWMAVGATNSLAQTVLAELPSTRGTLSFSYDPQSQVYELRPFRIPRYETLTNEAGQLQILVRGVALAQEQQLTSLGQSGPLTAVRFLPDPRGMLLTASYQTQPVVEHTRDRIRIFFGGTNPPVRVAPSTIRVAPTTPVESLTSEMLRIFIFWETGPMRGDAVPLSANGTIQYRELGGVTVGTLSQRQLEQHLEQQLGRYLRQFHVAVHQRQYPGPSITVLGELQQPDASGEHAWRAGTQLMELLDSLGGWSPNADVARVAIYRMIEGEYERQFVNVQAMAAQRRDFALNAGDIVYLWPRRTANTIGVYGLVQQPGNQPLSPGARLSEAVAQAGGPTASSSASLWVSLLRQDGAQRGIAYNQVKGDQDLALEHGDVVYVHTRVP